VRQSQRVSIDAALSPPVSRAPSSGQFLATTATLNSVNHNPEGGIMALVETITIESKDAHAPHKPVDCTATVVRGSDGAAYVQIDTYGSKDRKLPHKTSQSVQFNRQAAEQLISLFRSAFPDLR
jgi:hypothetical protein